MYLSIGKSRRTAIPRFTVGIFLLLSVALPIRAFGQQSITLLDCTMATSVQRQYPYEPSDRKNEFLTTDSRVYAWIKVSSFSDTHRVLWRWKFPDGRLYNEWSAVIGAEGKTQNWWKQFGWIAIQGFPPGSTPGDWRVDVILDTKLLKTMHFLIRQPADRQAHSGWPAPCAGSAVK